MIGTKLKHRDGSSWTVTAADETNGSFILAPDPFGPPVAVCYAELVADFRVKPADVTTPLTEADALRQQDEEANRTLGRDYARGHREARHADADPSTPEGSPEAFFATKASR